MRLGDFTVWIITILRGNIESHEFLDGCLVGILIVACFSAVLVKEYYDCCENVPYHRRTRLIFFSEPSIRRVSKTAFKEMKESLEGRILPDTDLESIRVRRIAQDIFEALKIEVQRQGSQLSAKSHLVGLDWEVLLVSGFGHNRFYDCGKIILFDWMFGYITSDAEIAFLIAREIGQIVCRHYAEILTINIVLDGVKNLKPVLTLIVLWDKYSTSVLFATHKQEVEEDYIGMYLSALAGSDPRVAPKLLEKIDEFWTPTTVFPSPKRRAEFLSLPEIMDKPVSMYLQECQKTGRN